jgi:hypothetical protein
VIRATGINWQRLGAVMPLESTGKDLTQRYMGSRQLYSSVDGASYYYSYISETLLPLQIKVTSLPATTQTETLFAHVSVCDGFFEG